MKRTTRLAWTDWWSAVGPICKWRRDSAKEEVCAECVLNGRAVGEHTTAALGNSENNRPMEVRRTLIRVPEAFFSPSTKSTDERSPTSTTLNRERSITNLAAVLPADNVG